ncbi:MAG: ComEA family DNA-binding protein [Thiobacillaceae bacterium]
MWRGLLQLLIVALLAMPAWAQVDINTATQSELESLPGIGPSKARAILDYRRQHGPFQSVDELAKVRGIGPATVERLRPEVIAGPVRRGRADADRAQTRRYTCAP